MLTKTTFALAAALIAGTASLAVAQGADPNLLNRYPGYNGANGVGDSPVLVAPAPNHSAPVGLEQRREPNRAPVATDDRPQVRTFRYDSAPLSSGGE